MDERLVQAAELAENGQLDEAHDIVMAIVEADKTNFDAWSALVELAQSDLERRTAIYKMWGLRPDDPEANLLLDKLKAGSLPPLDDSDGNFSSRKYKGNKIKPEKDYFTVASVILITYPFAFFIGFAINIRSLIEAYNLKRGGGVDIHNTGCLWAALVAGSIFWGTIILIINLFTI
mgnify:CR=1 FL=1